METQGGEAAAGSDPMPSEVSGGGQTNPSPYPPSACGHHSWSSSTGTATVSWNYSADNPNQNVVYYDPQRDVSVSGGTQTVATSAPHMDQSTTGITNATHSHSYAPYSSSVQQGYNPADYSNYYYNYSQTTNDSSVQQGGANPNSGAVYQPLTSFQNSGSYIGPTSNTYYNVGGHQTAPGYGTSNYYYQNSTWNGGSSGNNHAQLYQSYSSSDTNAVQSSSSAPANPFPYQQQYNQWPYYYTQPVPNAGGIPVADSTAADNIAISTSTGYSYPSSQPPPPGTTSWKSDASTSAVPPVQTPGVPGLQYVNYAPGAAGFQNHYVDQASGAQGFQNHYVNQAPAYPQNTANSNQLPLSNYANEQKTLHSHGPRSNISSVNYVSENFQPTFQGAATSDTRSVSKMQIPTNPRIAPGFSMAIPKGEKKNIEADSAAKPAYISVPMPKNDVKASQDGTEAIMQGSFPVSLCTYVERNLARCQDDAQRAVSQRMMKEIITKATADGTLHTKNWDIEPMFPLRENPVATTETSTTKNSNPFSLSTSRRSPSRRVKSRWEPVAEEKVAEKVEVVAKELTKDIHNSLEATKRMGNSWDFGKFLQSRQSPISKSNQRPNKKQRIGGNSSLAENGNASSDSDKEQDITKYYASAIALANSPEEKKRRENRSKRFERSQDSSTKLRNFLPNKDGAANKYKRRAISMLLTKSYEDGASLAVEDMDWDALTIKGTCQEIEKQYLRLTSAPDPATVRPEDVLEKALKMVETSQKNYLYKCDQLKSIRQDLTVQRIQNDLTVKVYETHARLALQAGDLPEYNQCQSQLKRLYAEGIKGCHLEFSAYNLLCVMLHSNNKRELLSSMASLSKEAKQHGAVRHALSVHSAVSSGNYVLFFKLYKTAPNLNTCLMDLYVEWMRFEAIKCMSKSYRPTIPVRYIAGVLGFLRIDGENCEAKEADGLEECEEWLKAHGAILSGANTNGELQIDTKGSSTTLYMPEPENAVAHGDSSLAVDDFLARTS